MRKALWLILLIMGGGLLASGAIAQSAAPKARSMIRPVLEGNKLYFDVRPGETVVWYYGGNALHTNSVTVYDVATNNIIYTATNKEAHRLFEVTVAVDEEARSFEARFFGADRHCLTEEQGRMTSVRFEDDGTNKPRSSVCDDGNFHIWIK